MKDFLNKNNPKPTQMPFSPHNRPSDDNANRILPYDMQQSAAGAFGEIEAIINELDISRSDKKAIKTAIEHNLQTRQSQIVGDINELQRRVGALAVPETVGKQLFGDEESGDQGAIKSQIIDYYQANREEFINGITIAFKKVGKEDDVKKILEKHVSKNEDKLFEQITNKTAKQYLQRMHDTYNTQCFQAHMLDYPGYTLMGMKTNFERFKHAVGLQKTADADPNGWKIDIEEKEKVDDEVELAFGASVTDQYFGFNMKKAEGGAYPLLDRGIGDNVFHFIRGDFTKAFGAEGKARLVTGFFTAINPIYWATTIFTMALFKNMDQRGWVDDCTFQFDPKTGIGKHTMPTYWHQWPCNAWPLNYPLKAHKRMIQARACEGYFPASYTALPKEYRKTLTIWLISSCIMTSKELGIPEGHPWAKAGEKARRKLSEKIGRTEEADFTLDRSKQIDMRDVPDCPGKKSDDNDDLKIKHTHDKNHDNDALKIKNLNKSDKSRNALEIKHPNMSTSDDLKRNAITMKTLHDNGSNLENMQKQAENSTPTVAV